METFWRIIAVLMGFVGFLASIFDWDWYFGVGWRSQFWDYLLGRDLCRIINGVVCFILFFGGILSFISDLGWL